MGYSDGDQLKVSIQCRSGPIQERRCTDFFCCLIYLLLLASVIFLAIFASQAIKMSREEIDARLKAQNHDNPLLSITHAGKYILASLAIVIALCFILFVIAHIIPAISVYIIIPLMLLLMLFMGVLFMLQYFNKDIPFLSKKQLNGYISPYSILTLVTAIAFLAGFVISAIVIIAKRDRFRFILPILNLAKTCFWDNFYMIFISIVLSAVSLAAIYLNVWFLEIAQMQQDGQHLVNKNVFSILVLVEILWTHGYLQAYSDFLFESIAVHWYYNESRFGRDGYSKIAENLWTSVKLSFRHAGTISFGFVLAYIPESISILLHRCQESSESVYSACCVCHKFTCSNLNKYNFIGTIMFSESFCGAGTVMSQIRAFSKVHFRELYMVGNFYITIVKLFAVLLALIICYFTLMEVEPNYYYNAINLIAPLVIVLLTSAEIATYFTNASGLTGDSIYFAHEIDYNCESTNFGNFNAAHCPKNALQIMEEARSTRFSID